MASVTVVKTIGSTGTFSTLQAWNDGAPANLTTAEQSAAGTFAVAAFQQGESLTFVGSGATGKFLHTDSTGPGTGSFVTYGITTGNPAASDVVTGGTSGATCILSSSTADFVGVIWQGQCQNQEFTGTGTLLTITGSTNSSTAYKDLTTVAGASFRDHASVQTNPLRYDATKGAAIQSTSVGGITIQAGEAFCRISQLQVASTGILGQALSSGAGNPVFEGLILEATYDGTSTGSGILATTGNAKIRNSVIIQRSTAADHIATSLTGSPFYYNCTFVAADDLGTAPTSIFLSGASGTVTIQNCGLFAG
jgi:hypothetical protein